VVTPQVQQLRLQFVDYLRKTFGEEFLRLVHEPEGVQIGERVLYRLKGAQEAERHELTEREIEEQRRAVVALAKSTGVDESAVTFEPPVISGLPYPRLIDLPGSGIMWDKDLKNYFESDEPLPSKDFSLEWVLGVVLTPSEKMLMYLDSTHSRVKAIFRVFYESEFGAAEGPKIVERFRRFLEKERELKDRSEQSRDIVWAKIIQVDAEPLWIRIRGAE